MKRSRLEYRFPVLAKELAQQAERRTTYLTRVIFVVCVTGAFLVPYEAIRASGSLPQSVLGTGRGVFSFLVRLQLVAIFLYVPALVSGAVAREKERNSLTLLLLTRLRPGDIILEKLLGRLTPVFTLQFVSLPLLAVAYSLGGVSPTWFWSSVYLVLLTCLQVGSFSLMLSTWCRTTVGAFALSYLLVPAVGLASWLLELYGSRPGLSRASLVVWTPSLLDLAERRTFAECVVHSSPALASVPALLLVARGCLFRRVDVPARNHLVGLLRAVDRLMTRLNRVCGDIVLLPDRTTLPGYEPVAWREVAKKSLGKPQYVIRMLLLAEVPIVFVALLATAGAFRRSAFRVDLEPLSLCVFVVWAIAALILGVLGTNLIVSERRQQTLSILLTTPIRRSDILRQKMRGLSRLIRLFCVPFLTLALFGAWLRAARDGHAAALYLVSSFLSVLIYLPLLGWLGTFLGLRSRGRLAAFFLFLACVLIWVALPVVANIRGTAPAGVAGGLFLLSPMTMVLVAESGGQHTAPLFGLFSWWAVAPNAALHGWTLYALRRICLNRAGRYLHAT